MPAVFHLRIPFVILFLALSVWLAYRVFSRGEKGKWL